MLTIMTQDQIDKLNILERVAAPKPRFFRIVRGVGVVLVAVSGAVLGAHVAWPEWLTTIAGCVAVAGSAITAVSQVTVKG